MTSVLTAPGKSEQLQAPEEQLTLRTTGLSLLHRPVRRRLSPTRIYLLTVAATYAPLVVAAALSGYPLAEPSANLRMPFLYDVNTACMVLLSFPTLLILTLTDDATLNAALTAVQADGVVSFPGGARILLQQRWEKRFRVINVIAQVLAVVVGLLVVYLNYRASTAPSFGSWPAPNGTVTPAGWLFMLELFLFFGLIPVFVVRSVGISLFFAELVKVARLEMLPLHPDRCGGLRPVGRLGLRNQYALTVVGINLVCLGYITFEFLNHPESMLTFLRIAFVSYVILGPTVFLGPLLPFRGAMARTKGVLLGEVAQRLRRELSRLRAQLGAGVISREDEQLLDRLKKLGGMIDELPVWPFDAGTLKRFLSAYVAPLASAVGIAVLDVTIKWVTTRFWPGADGS